MPERWCWIRSKTMKPYPRASVAILVLHALTRYFPLTECDLRSGLWQKRRARLTISPG